MSLPGNYANLFADCKLFHGLREPALNAVLQAGIRLQIAPDEHFYHQGDPATAFYVLLEGRAKMAKVTVDGHQVLARFLEPGECYGIVAAQEKATYPFSVQAVGVCTAVAWNSETLRDLLHRYPGIALNALQVMTEQCQKWQRRYEEMVTACVEQRVAGTVVRLARQAGKRVQSGVLIDLPLSREDLAEMTGTTLYTVSRILSRWKDDGLVELGRERVVIRDGHGLVTIAEAFRKK